MSSHTRSGSKKAFSLLELLLVIFIISLVYFLGFSGFEKEKKRLPVLTPMTLKEKVMQSPVFKGRGTLICIDACRSCYFREDITASFEPYEGKTKLTHLKTYTLDSGDNLVELEYGRYQGQKICLKMEFFQNGSSTPLILQDDDGTYFLPAFFGEAQKAASLEEAKEMWLKNDDALQHQGDYY